MTKTSRPVSAWRPAVIVLPALLLLAAGDSVSAESADRAFGLTGMYTGVFAGPGRMDNRTIDLNGFANWGSPGWRVDYDETGFAGGILVGKKCDIGGMPLRFEIDATFGDLSEETNQLNPSPESEPGPQGLDETAKSAFRWIATARAGIEHTVGPVTVFATGGLALARIANSITDMDFSNDPAVPPWLDPDDSFHESSTEIGWVIGAGVEAPLADAWMLRLEGLYLDFGRSTHEVNHSGNNSCGRGGPKKPCPFGIENELSTVRLALIYRFW